MPPDGLSCCAAFPEASEVRPAETFRRHRAKRLIGHPQMRGVLT